MFISDLLHSNATLQDKLQALYRLSGGQKIDLRFRKPYIDLLESFGNPHLSLPPVIHVAGTNGKGSTISFMRSILEAAGKRVHVYTSPHLIEFNERIVLAGQEIDDVSLENLIDEALTYNGDNTITFFEITTAIAFTAFSRIPADIVLLEVGLGGRLDCTNIIPDAAVSVITPVSIDHAEFLGETCDVIALEKAGIMKPNVPCVIGPQENAALFALKHAAQKTKTPLYLYGDAYEWNDKYPVPCLVGTHQLQNAATAIMAVKLWSDSITEDQIAAGLTHAAWRGRLQNINQHYAYAGWDIWYDGGHNEAAGSMLAAQLAQWRQEDGKACHLIVGMMDHKDPDAFLRPLLDQVHSVTVVPITTMPHSLSLEQIKHLPHDAMTHAPHVRAALDDLTKASETGRILIAGSLYLAQDIF